jgi:hypothetical protein
MRRPRAVRQGGGVTLPWRSWRLTFALQRQELLILLGATALLVVGSVLAARMTSEARAAFDACVSQVEPGSDACRSLSAPLNDWSSWEGVAKLAAQWSPMILGLFLGVPVVAREIEGRTAPIAWALDPGRGRWLLQRAVPVLAVALVAGVLIGIGGEMVTQAPPFREHSLGAGFSDYGSRLGQIPVRTVAVLVLGVAVGALVPRQLPALLLTGAAALVLFTALTLGTGAWMQAAAEPIAMDQGYESGARVFDQAFRDNATGALISTADFDQQQLGSEDLESTAPPGMTRVWLGIPGVEYGQWVLRESGIVLGLTLIVGAATSAVVRRRRPG